MAAPHVVLRPTKGQNDTPTTTHFPASFQTEMETSEKSGTREFGPIVVITFKNHSLDEFLLDILTWLQQRDSESGCISTLEGIVRIGSRSKCPQLNDYNLKELVGQQLAKSKQYRQLLRHQVGCFLKGLTIWHLCRRPVEILVPIPALAQA